ncbi:MAG: hypothetical protein L6Q59_17370, partial [Ignavibacteriaceae bacterium]|nr:hypothetical protein [Ignavibacteriaceae bacterium]
MYFKITSAKGRHYAKIVKSFREGKKVKQKVLFNFGALEDLPTSSLESFVYMITEKILKHRETTLLRKEFSSDELKGGDILCYGYLPYKHLWKKLQIEEIL